MRRCSHDRPPGGRLVHRLSRRHVPRPLVLGQQQDGGAQGGRRVVGRDAARVGAGGVMSARKVTTQAELDAAPADAAVDWIEIRSPRGVWLELGNSGSATVTAYGSATVTA